MWFEKNFDTYTVVQKSVQKDDNFNNSELKTFLTRISSWQYLRNRRTVWGQKKLSLVYVKFKFQSKKFQTHFIPSSPD